MDESSAIIFNELSQAIEVNQSNQAPFSIDVIGGPVGPQGPAGRSIQIFVQAEEPPNPQPGDIWLGS